jgi:hypothetical protein
MAIVNSYQLLYPGYGQPTAYGVINGTALSGASQQTNSFTTSNTPSLAQGMTKGIIRVKVYNGGSSTTTLAYVVNVTDGTNTYIIGYGTGIIIATGANSGCDFYIDCGVDISFVQVNILTTLSVGTTTATLDAEVVAGP